MKLSELVRRARLTDALSADGDPEIERVTFDSREARGGTLFVALRGARFDGHDFVPGAIAAGASAVMVDHEWNGASELPTIRVPDTRAALADVATAFFRNPASELRVAGITGTNGKTTTSFILEAIVGPTRPVGVLGTVNYRWLGHSEPAPNTTPENLVAQRLLRAMRDDEVEVAVMEVSSHGLATSRVDGLHFDVVLFTNFSQDHLDFHESMEDYLEAKLRLFGPVLESSISAGKAPVAVVNLDDAVGHAFASKAAAAGARVVTYGCEGEPSWRVENIQSSLAGSSFDLTNGAQTSSWTTGLIGEFNVANAVGSILAARALGLSDDEIAPGLAKLTGVPGRLQRVGERAFVDYAHTPDALEVVLQTLRRVLPGGGRIVTLVGAGGDRDRAKRPLMGAAAARHSDHVIVTNDNPRTEDPASIAAAIVEGISLPEADSPARDGYQVVLNRREAIRLAIAETAPTDVVLVAGKGHENYQEIEGQRLPFDDAVELRRALEAT